MIPRDSRAWWVIVFGAWLASLAAHPDLIERMMEGERSGWVSALCQLIAIGGAYMKASPVHEITDEGRARFIEDAKRR